jgi:hypothetical protein
MLRLAPSTSVAHTRSTITVNLTSYPDTAIDMDMEDGPSPAKRLKYARATFYER